MPELQRHHYRWAGTTIVAPYVGIDLQPAAPRCTCGWAGTRTPLEAVARAQHTTHLLDVAALTTAGLALGMTETDAETTAAHLAAHSH